MSVQIQVNMAPGSLILLGQLTQQAIDRARFRIKDEMFKFAAIETPVDSGKLLDSFDCHVSEKAVHMIWKEDYAKDVDQGTQVPGVYLTPKTAKVMKWVDRKTGKIGYSKGHTMGSQAPNRFSDRMRETARLVSNQEIVKEMRAIQGAFP